MKARMTVHPQQLKFQLDADGYVPAGDYEATVTEVTHDQQTGETVVVLSILHRVPNSQDSTTHTP